MTFVLQPVRVRVGSTAEEGLLVFKDDVLVAVLTHLSEQYGEMAGDWFLEHGFGDLDGPTHPIFPDPDVAQRWIAKQLRRLGLGLITRT